MKFVLALTLLVVLAVLIDFGDAWRRRRRRRSSRRRRRWGRKVIRGVGRVVKKGIGFYKKNKSWINPIAGHVFRLGWDSDMFAKLATLKAEDSESYNDFMQQVRATIADDYEEEDVNEMMAFLDELADMQPDELELLKQDEDINANKEAVETDLTRDLDARITALKSD